MYMNMQFFFGAGVQILRKYTQSVARVWEVVQRVLSPR